MQHTYKITACHRQTSYTAYQTYTPVHVALMGQAQCHTKFSYVMDPGILKHVRLLMSDQLNRKTMTLLCTMSTHQLVATNRLILQAACLLTSWR